MKYVGLYDNNKDIVTKERLEAVESAIPTKVSELTNDANYITAVQAPVQSVNNKTGTVSLTASDVGAVSKTGSTMTGNLNVGSASLETNGYVTGTWLKTTANIASNSAASKIAVIDNGWIYTRTAAQIKSDIGLGNVDNVKQYSATNPPPYPVTSVNGQTGEVNLVASEVGAVPTSRTVNGKALSANITLTASDVGAATMTQVNSAIQTAIGNAIGGSY